MENGIILQIEEIKKSNIKTRNLLTAIGLCLIEEWGSFKKFIEKYFPILLLIWVEIEMKKTLPSANYQLF